MSDQLQKLEELLPALPAAADQRRLGDRLDQATQTLREATQQAQRLRAVIKISCAVGYGATPDQAEVLQDLRRTALEVAEALDDADDPESLRTAVWDYEKTFLPALANVDRAARVQWKALVAERFQPLITFGDLLAIMGVGDLGGRMKRCGQRAQMVGTGPAEQVANEVEELLAEIGRLQAERSTAIGTGDVGEFLNALAERRATLLMITPEVRNWLKDHDALEQFSVAPI